MVLVGCTQLEAYDCGGRADCPRDGAVGAVDGLASVIDAPALDATVDASPPRCGTTAALGPRFEPSEWTDSIAGAGSTAQITDGVARVRCEVGDAYAGLISDETHVFADSSLTVELELTVEPTDADVVAGFTVDVPAGEVGFEIQGTSLTAVVGDTEGASVPYAADAHRFLRVTNDRSQYVFETSPDGAAWRRFDALGAPDSVGAGAVAVYAYTYVDATVTARFLALNPGTPGACL